MDVILQIVFGSLSGLLCFTAVFLLFNRISEDGQENR